MFLCCCLVVSGLLFSCALFSSRDLLFVGCLLLCPLLLVVVAVLVVAVAVVVV